MNLVWVDYFIIAIVAVSAVISLFRGFVKELFSLITWVLAFWVSIKFAPDAAALMESMITAPSARLGLAYVLLFLSTLIAGAILTHFLAQAVKRTHLSGTDRMVGVIFGLARGLVVVTALVMVAQIFTPVEEDPWWDESAFIHRFEDLAEWARGFLPEEWRQELERADAQARPEPKQGELETLRLEPADLTRDPTPEPQPN